MSHIHGFARNDWAIFSNIFFSTILITYSLIQLKIYKFIGKKQMGPNIQEYSVRGFRSWFKTKFLNINIIRHDSSGNPTVFGATLAWPELFPGYTTSQTDRKTSVATISPSPAEQRALRSDRTLVESNSHCPPSSSFLSRRPFSGGSWDQIVMSTIILELQFDLLKI